MRSIGLLALAAGLIGAAGVVLAAAASHGGDPRLLGSAAALCLAHAPALLALAALSARLAWSMPAAAALAVGTVLFASDMIVRTALGTGLFPGSAPAGGALMIAGWVIVALDGLRVLTRRPGAGADSGGD
jgi:uncharacterized membrane protein YgdD (TMEM256/DUF423 family)